MRKVLLFHLVTLVFLTPAFSQNTAEDFPKSAKCFSAVKAAIDPNLSPKIKTICIGQRITVKLKNNKFIRGRIQALSPTNIVTTTGKEIDVNSIKWIKANKLTADRAITGTLMTAVGLALYLPVRGGEVDDPGAGLFTAGLGSSFIIGGVAILLSRTKYRLNRKDKLIFENSEVARTSPLTTR